MASGVEGEGVLMVALAVLSKPGARQIDQRRPLLARWLAGRSRLLREQRSILCTSGRPGVGRLAAVNHYASEPQLHHAVGSNGVMCERRKEERW